jgi:formylmethanofuran dehydrogenase subunit B
MTPLTCPFCGLACDDLALADGAIDTRGCAKAAAGFGRRTGVAAHAVGGQPASLDEAAAAAARLLRAARAPLIAGLGADLAGIRTLLALADRTGATIDHAHSPAFLRNLAVVQATGWVASSFSEITNRADYVLVVGRDPTPRYPRWRERLVGNSGALYRAAPPEVEILDPPENDLLDVLGALRLLVAGGTLRPAAVGGVATAALGRVAERLRAARYGVVAWTVGEFAESGAELAVETIAEIVRALNKSTRCVGLPLGGDDNAQGAVQAMLWQAGWPSRISFATGVPRYDRWGNDAARLLASGEADALLWVAAIAAVPPPAAAVAVIALVAGDVALAAPPAVTIRIGCPALDHDGAVVRADGLVTLPLRAARPSAAPSVAAAAAAILEYVEGGRS